MDYLYLLDLTGTFVFAISGTLAAADKKLDLFGATFIGFVTAIGGGTLRDVLLGIQPVSWMRSIEYPVIILLAVAITFLFKKNIIKLRKTLFLFDTIGIGVFTIMGLQKALLIDIMPIFAIIMGMFTAVMGGVIRDILCNEIPLIFRKEIYATACLSGAIIFLILDGLNVNTSINNLVTISAIIFIRVVSIKYRLSLPTIT